ncbi:MAG: aromatic acid exporter family protein [Thermaerobacter sp.]|nr:aromatic acid exporter family protein [Thermaerobacter sp.]
MRKLFARAGVSLQLTKTALAAGLSWWLAEALFSRARPYFAPLAAILTIQVTVAKSVSLGGQRILGVAGGIVVSFAVAHWLGVSAGSVALVVLTAMGLAAALGLGPNAVTQSAITGLLVMALGTRASYAAARLVDTVLGALVAVLVNALLIPPDATPAAVHAVSGLSTLIGQRLTDLPDPVGTGQPLVDRLATTRAVVAGASESLRFAPLLRGRRRRLERLRRAERMLVRLTWRVLDLEDTVRELTPADRRQFVRFNRLRAAMQEVLARYSTWVVHPDDAACVRLHRAAQAVTEEWTAAQTVPAQPAALSPLYTTAVANLARLVPELGALPPARS